MENEFLYMLGVVAVGFAITYGMRALPFLLFAGRGRTLPQWVERLGALISPVIIAALVVYSYSGLQWRTPWPYLAGAITVAVHLWKGNPLASIAAGTVLYMCLLSCGCMTAESDICYDVSHPLIHMTNEGILFLDKPVTPKEAVALLAKKKIPKDATIYILVDEDFQRSQALRVFEYEYLRRAGYNRTIYVSRRAAYSSASEPVQDPRVPARPPAQPGSAPARW